MRQPPASIHVQTVLPIDMYAGGQFVGVKTQQGLFRAVCFGKKSLKKAEPGPSFALNRLIFLRKLQTVCLIDVESCFYTFANLFQVVNYFSDNFILTAGDLTDCFLF